MSTVSKATARKLRVIRDQIIATPKKFNMSSWALKGECGTTCCIAGYAAVNAGVSPKALMLRDGELYPGDVPTSIRGKVFRQGKDIVVDAGDVAVVALGLDPLHHDQLFYDERWPVEYRDAFAAAGSPEAQALIAAARIEHYIATGE
jgi:hypothetical protein